MKKGRSVSGEKKGELKNKSDALVLDESNIVGVITFNSEGEMLVKDPRKKQGSKEE